MEFEVPLYGKKKKCIVCGCAVGTKGKSHQKKAISVGMEKVINFWISSGIIIHYNEHKLCSTCSRLENPSIKRVYSSNIDEFKAFLDFVRNYYKNHTHSDKIEEKLEEKEEREPFLDVKQISEEDCVECCGLEQENLKQLSEYSGCSVQVIFEFFSKCRHKISDRFTGVLFGKDHSTVSWNFGRVLGNLTEKFVPKWIGSSAFKREQIIKEHTPYLFQKILPNIRGGIDGTYFYIEKSSVFNIQQKTYSSHKGRNLFKEMVIVLPDGKFFDLIGPFFSDGNHNDEWIWRYIVANNCEDVGKVFNKNDEFLADRGFLHIEEEDGIFKLQCPVGLSPNKKQLSTDEANHSRLITRFRNVVERAFGRFKARWKIIEYVISSGLWPKMHDLIRLLAATDNAFLQPIWTDQESDKDDIESITKYINMENELQSLFESKGKKPMNCTNL